MIDRSAVPELMAVSAQSRCCAVSEVSRSNCVIPMTPLRGVRISWLMLARNSLLARAAASAFTRACSSERRICRSLVMSSVAPNQSPRFSIPILGARLDAAPPRGSVLCADWDFDLNSLARLEGDVCRCPQRGDVVTVQHGDDRAGRVRERSVGGKLVETQHPFRHGHRLREAIGLPDTEPRSLFGQSHAFGTLSKPIQENSFACDVDDRSGDADRSPLGHLHVGLASNPAQFSIRQRDAAIDPVGFPFAYRAVHHGAHCGQIFRVNLSTDLGGRQLHAAMVKSAERGRSR